MTAVRPAGPDDAGRLREIARAAYTRYVALLGFAPPPMNADFDAAVAVGAAWCAGSPAAGYVLARAAGPDWLVENLAVAPEAEGRGLGRLLLAFAEGEGARRGFVRAVLYTNAAMERPRALYPRLGWTETGRRRENGLDRVHFAKALG